MKQLRSAFKSVLRNLKRMLGIAWKMDKRLTLVYFITGAFSSLLSLGVTYSATLLIDYLQKNQMIGLPTTIPAIVIIVLAARYLISLLDDIVTWSINRTYVDYLFRYKIQNELNYRFYKKLLQLDVAHLENPEVQNKITKARDTLTWRPPDFLRMSGYLLSDVVLLVSTLVILLSFGWYIPLIVLIVTLPRLLLRARYGSMQWSIYGTGVPQVKKLYYFMHLLSQDTALREIKIFQSQPAILTKLKEIQDYLLAINRKPVDNYLKISIIPFALETVVLFLLAYLKLGDVLHGALSIGLFTFFIQLISQLNQAAGWTVDHISGVYENNLYVDDYFSVLELPTIIKEDPHPVLFEMISPPRIEFKHVSFAYPNGENVLKDISFVIEPGENIALVGENGAGKSTIIKLLCRFYDVTEGEILINGVNIKQLSLQQWYRFIGTLFQDFVKYNFTVAENIMFGNPGREDTELMKKAAKQAGAEEFIEKLPKQYEQILGKSFEEGEELSIGQWQKLAIARAFYEEAPVLILDEPTSAIDALAEFEIFTNLEKTYKDKTLIFVSHRFSTVRNADRILVVEQGKIVEEGTHEELMEKKKLYAKMFAIQAEGYK